MTVELIEGIWVNPDLIISLVVQEELSGVYHNIPSGWYIIIETSAAPGGVFARGNNFRYIKLRDKQEADKVKMRLQEILLPRGDKL